MTVIRQLTFEGNSLTGTNGFDTISGSYLAVESAAPLVGAYSLSVGPNTGGADLGYGDVDFDSAPSHGIAFYIKPVARVDASVIFVRALSPSLTRWNLQANPDGTFSLYSASTTFVASTPALDNGVTYRFEVWRSSTELQFRYAIGDDASTLVGSHTGGINAVAKFRIGPSAAVSSWHYILDEIHVEDTATIPALPSLAEPAPESIFGLGQSRNSITMTLGIGQT